MKIFNVKTAIAAVCVVAAGFGGVKAYNAANQSEADLLLAENVEALSSPEDGRWVGCITNKFHDCWLPGGRLIRYAINIY